MPTKLELLSSAIELLNAIQTDLLDTLQHPTVVEDMSINAAKDNTQQLLDTLEEMTA